MSNLFKFLPFQTDVNILKIISIGRKNEERKLAKFLRRIVQFANTFFSIISFYNQFL